MARTGTFQSTDGTGIPSIIHIREGQYESRRGPMPALIVDSEKCGMRFNSLIVIVDPDGPCPLIQVKQPFGMDFVRMLIDHIEGIKSLPSMN